MDCLLECNMSNTIATDIVIGNKAEVGLWEDFLDQPSGSLSIGRSIEPNWKLNASLGGGGNIAVNRSSLQFEGSEIDRATTDRSCWRSMGMAEHTRSQESSQSGSGEKTHLDCRLKEGSKKVRGFEMQNKKRKDHIFSIIY